MKNIIQTLEKSSHSHNLFVRPDARYNTFLQLTTVSFRYIRIAAHQKFEYINNDTNKMKYTNVRLINKIFHTNSNINDSRMLLNFQFV